MKLLLNKQLRFRLEGLAAEIVACPDAEKAERAAYQQAAAHVRRVAQAKFPPKDMRVLRKYKKAHIDDCIKLKLASGGVEMFRFDKGMGPLTADPTHAGTIYEADGATTAVVADWVAATGALQDAKKRKLADYQALIRAARTLEDVTAIWPEAEQVRPPRSTALVALSEEAVDRIRADVATRQTKRKKGKADG